MSAYLIENPGVLTQYSSRSSWSPSRPTGLTVLHTSENVMDSVGPDTGTEVLAAYIRSRSTPGSYHSIADSDSNLDLVPFDKGAWQDGTGSNGMALSISFVCRTVDWDRMTPGKRRGFLRQGAQCFVRQQAWLKANGYPTTPLRLVSKAESDRGVAGLIYHGHRDPGRRSDPGVFPPNDFPLAEFIEECRLALGGAIMANLDKDDYTNIAKAVRAELERTGSRLRHVEDIVGDMAQRQVAELRDQGYTVDGPKITKPPAVA